MPEPTNDTPAAAPATVPMGDVTKLLLSELTRRHNAELLAALAACAKGDGLPAAAGADLDALVWVKA